MQPQDDQGEWSTVGRKSKSKQQGHAGHSIGLLDHSLTSIQVFRENERLLHDFFNNPHITNQNKLNEWKRIKEYEMKHIGAEEIDAADQLRKLSRDPAIATKRGHLSQCGIAEQDRTWVATHTDRQARGEESVLKPNTKKELEHHLAQIYDLCHARELLATPRIQEQFAIAIEDVATVIRIRELENRLFSNVHGRDPGHEKALVKDRKLLSDLQAISRNLSRDAADIDREIAHIKTQINQGKSRGYFLKYLKYKEKYLALKKKLNISNL
jgi:hypothetical protein